MTQWETQEALLLFIPFTVLLIWTYINRRSRKPSLQFSTVKHIGQVPKTLRGRLAPLPFLLKVLAISLAIIALARPQKANEKIRRNVEGIDIMVALDISDSMLIEDMTPENRLEASKKTIKEFVQGRISDRIGLVVFSGESYTRVPLTLDYPLLLKNLREVKTTRNIKMGTAIGVALANAVARLKDSTAKSRVIIFLTDGENNSGTIDPVTAIEIAKGYGIRIYSIGMGKDGQAQLPIYNQGAAGRQMKRYRPIHSKINEDLLQKMANETGGRFWRTTSSQDLDQVFKVIDDLEKTKIEVSKYTKYAELFPPWVEWSLALYLLGFFLGRSILRRSP